MSAPAPAIRLLLEVVCSCPGDQTLVGGLCSCPGDQTLVDFVCSCPGDQTLVGGVCSCPGDQTIVDNVCSCPGDQTLVGGLCSCPGDQTLIDEVCSCPGDQTLIGGVCSCPGDQTLGLSGCACPGGQTLVDNVCSCPGDQTLVGGVCSCPGDQTLVSDVCSCPGDQTLVGGLCSCPGDQTLMSGLCSCPGDQTLVGGVCSCPGDQTLVGGLCSCPGDQTLVGGVCSCPGDQTLMGGLCSCPGDQTLAGGVCSCPGDQTLMGGLCSCPGDQTLVGGVCSCPGDQTLMGGLCSCPGDQTLVGGVCSCPGDQTLVSDVCSCPGDQTLVDDVCSCPGDQTLVDDVCSCPGDQTLVGGVCSCPGDQTLIGGVCSCPGDQTLVSDVCSCPGDQTLIGGLCSCPGDQTLVGGLCSCPGDQTLIGGVCSCPGDQTLVGGVCSCPGDQSLILGLSGFVCSCPGDQTLVGGVCSCPGDQTLVSGVCSCPGDQTLVGGVCSCPGDQTLIDDVCSCPGDQTLVDDVCSCPGDQTLIGNVCSCPGDQTLVSDVCSCPGDQTLVGGVCSCPGDQTLVDDVCSCPEGLSLILGVCSCPEGEHLEGNECVPTCFWKANNVGFECAWSDPDKDSLKLKDDCSVHGPVPKDGYVNDGRTNANDADHTDPVISITATKEGDLVGVSHKAIWKDYAFTPETLENEVAFSSFGVFDLSLTATDYRHTSTCTGCIAIVDNYPPTAKDKCTATDSQATPVSYSASNLDDAIAEEAKFTSFYDPDNIINNGVYDSATGANERCDATSGTIQNFFETIPSPIGSVDTTCFDSNFVTDLLDETPSFSPLLLTDVELNALQCTRCCSKSLTLQEYYYDYKCGTAFEDTEKKTSVSPDSCSFGYCLNMPGDTLVTATASITSTANTKTGTIIAGLPTPIVPGSNDIHRSITCPTFSSTCPYTSLVKDLFDHSAQWGVTVPGTYDVDDYVFWRYSVGTESWVSWDDTASLSFTEPETEVYVEAWTHCGKVFEDTFKVILHAHSPRDVCGRFNDMWTDVTSIPRKDGSHICAYPNSDFALMQFAYDSEVGMAHDPNTVKGKYTNVKCYVKLADSGELSSVTRAEVPLSWTPGVNGRIEVTKQLALEMVHDPDTEDNTDVSVECEFTFTHYDATTAETDICPHSFSITDCDRAEIETYAAESVCKAGECMSPTGTPGPMEACGGSVFTTESYVTQEKTLTGDCCDECSTTLTCATLAESSPVGGIQRCEAASAPLLFMMALRGEADWKQAATPSVLLALLGVSALVAVVVLVVIKRRKAAVARATNEYDVYYPLLE
ncbi:unnamed protein product [Phytophthora lilii]|uniref:Unnamed protein product n=1 Tax=Phytophthora lilii TaxID=2077276 RepID=A0A9W6U0Z6_9STRA|nr:unnamed protein product [Phytophthora lilii]